MARYWVYLNNQVMGPYELEQLIRLQGFSRQTMISVDDYSGTVSKWISPAEIPELGRIFKKVDELHESPFTNVPPRPAPKTVRPKMPLRLTTVPPPVEEPHQSLGTWIWIVFAVALLAGGLLRWNQVVQRKQHADERQTAQTLIETVSLPATSLYSTLRQYLQTQQVPTRWDFERSSEGPYHVTLSWLSADKSGVQLPVYAFEVNLQVNTVRGLNTAAIRLLSEGFPAPKPKAAAKPHRDPGDLFPGAINDRRQAFEQGDFDAVWSAFSRRQQDEMSRGGMSHSSYVRLQKLTHAMSTGLQQSIVKTKSESETSRLVLIRQTQPKHPDIYIKQHWVWEDSEWRLDDEEKKIASVPLPVATDASSVGNSEKLDSGDKDVSKQEVPSAPSSAGSTPSPASLPHLPGLSDAPADTH